MSLSKLACYFLIDLSFGFFCSFLFTKNRVEKNYFIYHGAIFSLVFALGIWFGWSEILVIHKYLLCGSLFFWTSYWIFRVKSCGRPQDKFLNSDLLITSTLALAGSLGIIFSFLDPHLKIHLLDHFSLAMVTGMSMAAMCLGHWYLTHPTLSIDELLRLTWIMIATLAVRFVFVIHMGLRLFSGHSESEMWGLLLSSTSGIFFLMRVLWGLFLPAVLSYMIYQSVKIRSTQSATGILYVLTLTALTGELLHLFLVGRLA